LWGAACNVVGIVNFETFLENTKAYRQHLREAEYGPLTDPDFLRSISPIHKVNRITAPLMVVHGRNDPRVPVGEAEQIAAALRERGRPVELLVFDDEGHGIAKQPNRVVYFERLVEFFGEHLKG
jgi:dipeptidyl aminopeptidase/acylaminoacyl peptidase